jgi:hypothetical protein
MIPEKIMSDIKCVKLITGEDVIADYSVNDGIVKLENPVQVSMVPSRSSGQPNFGFIPFPLVSNDKVIYINSDKIVFVCEPAEEFLVQYNSLFSNIIAPTQNLII